VSCFARLPPTPSAFFRGVGVARSVGDTLPNDIFWKYNVMTKEVQRHDKGCGLCVSDIQRCYSFVLIGGRSVITVRGYNHACAV